MSLRVRVTRSFKKRVDWLMDKLETDDESFAEAEVRRSDDAHAARMHAQFGVTWGDPLLYDLVLNTDRVSIESWWRRSATGRPAGVPGNRAVAGDAGRSGAEGAHPRCTRGPRHDPRHQHHHRIEGRQGATQRHRPQWQESAEAARVASTVVGVGNVDNQLRLMAVTRRFARG